jgi:hypothetical protein
MTEMSVIPNRVLRRNAPGTDGYYRGRRKLNRCTLTEVNDLRSRMGKMRSVSSLSSALPVFSRQGFFPNDKVEA